MKPSISHNLTRADIKTLSPNTLLKAECPPTPYYVPDSSLGCFHSTKGEQVLGTSKSKCFSQLHLVSLKQFLAQCIPPFQLTILSKGTEKMIYHTLLRFQTGPPWKPAAQENPFESQQNCSRPGYMTTLPASKFWVHSPPSTLNCSHHFSCYQVETGVQVWR